MQSNNNDFVKLKINVVNGNSELLIKGIDKLVIVFNKREIINYSQFVDKLNDIYNDYGIIDKITDKDGFRIFDFNNLHINNIWDYISNNDIIHVSLNYNKISYNKNNNRNDDIKINSKNKKEKNNDSMNSDKTNQKNQNKNNKTSSISSSSSLLLDSQKKKNKIKDKIVAKKASSSSFSSSSSCSKEIKGKKNLKYLPSKKKKKL